MSRSPPRAEGCPRPLGPGRTGEGGAGCPEIVAGAEGGREKRESVCRERWGGESACASGLLWWRPASPQTSVTPSPTGRLY